MKEIKLKGLDQSVFYEELSNGLKVILLPFKNKTNYYINYTTKYGSINLDFIPNGSKKMYSSPKGIAHFLEHKLFENEDCDVFELYAKTGASANAFTSFDKTCYLFSCSKNYRESLEILLTFVQEPYFTKESVDKEQGIIGQEIKMCNDNPEWRVFFNLLSCLYENHPVKIDIAGTVESIAEIDADLLYKCYNTFYNLNNMVLAIAGNVDADEILAICDKCLKPCEDKGLETVFPNEPDTIVKKEFVEEHPVGTPIFNIGYKCSPKKGYENLKASMEAIVAAGLIADPSSALYQRLLSEGLINSGFGFEVFNGDGYFSVIFSGESVDPYKVRDAISEEVENTKTNGFDNEHFLRLKKSNYGSCIRELNNVEAVANLLINSSMEDVGPYDAIKVISEMTCDDVLSFIKNELCADKLAISVVKGAAE